VERVRLRELRSLTEAEAAAIADDLLPMLPFRPVEPDRGSGLIEQQRWFSLVRARQDEGG
jgi:hypothetical protein